MVVFSPWGKGRDTHIPLIMNLWDLTEHKTFHLKVFHIDLKPQLSSFLSFLPLDEGEALDWIENEDMRDYHRACWELEFLPVAQKLLESLGPL